MLYTRWKFKESILERKFAWHRRLVHNTPTKPFCIFDNGHLHIGQGSKHRIHGARMWNTLVRLKFDRK